MRLLHSVRRDHVGLRVKLPNSKVVYLAVKLTRLMNDKRAVVIVDSNKFLQLLQNNPFKFDTDLINKSPETWKNYYKYHLAEEGFSYGVGNPVPLPWVACNQYLQKEPIYKRKHLFFRQMIATKESTIEYASFIDGMTRTIWLMSKGAEFIPVECWLAKDGGAELLALLAGCKGENIKTVEELTKEPAPITINHFKSGV